MKATSSTVQTGPVEITIMLPNKVECSGASGIGYVDLEELFPVSTLRCFPSVALILP